jgi:hypothetical protein
MPIHKSYVMSGTWAHAGFILADEAETGEGDNTPDTQLRVPGELAYRS